MKKQKKKEKSGLEKTEEQKKIDKSLKYSVADGSAHSVMIGAGEQYVSPYAISLNATSSQIGVLSSLPPLAGAIFQLFSPKAIDWMKSRKNVILIAAFLQAVMWLPILFIPLLLKSFQVDMIILFFTLYAIFGSFAAPAWMSWMGDLVPENQRGTYFGLRTKITSTLLFIGIVGGGLILNKFSSIGLFWSFGILFVSAMVFRLISWYFLLNMYEPKYEPRANAYFSFTDFIKRLSKSNFGQFVLYVCCLNFAVYIATPFFALYVLRDLNWTYMQYMIYLGASVLVAYITMTAWGEYSDRFGNKIIFSICGILVAIIPFLFLLSTNWWFLVGANAFSGLAWAGFNLSAANFVFDTVTPEKRARCTAYYNVLNGISLFLGAMFGSLLLVWIKDPLVFVSVIPIVFFISGAARLLVSLIFIPRIKEVRQVEKAHEKELFWRLVAIEPVRGFVGEATGGFQKGAQTIGMSANFVAQVGTTAVKKGTETVQKEISTAEKIMQKEFMKMREYRDKYKEDLLHHNPHHIEEKYKKKMR